ncbi:MULTISPECIES: ABC transporter substrate-binding protein [unclassified Streptomyces]|uniref:ABC transporter substrate-binding protein n=1 Tax=unclassified Streptomyces TaxID=2593676 RepID=UPI0036E489E3
MASRPSCSGRGKAAAAAIALALALTACGDDNDSTSSDGDRRTVTVAALPLVDCAMLYIARDRGLFEKEGLDVRVQQIQQSLQALPALSKGQIDMVASANYVTYFQAHDKGTLDIRIVAEAIRAAPKMMDVLVPKDSDIKSVADLTGRKLAVNVLNNVQSLTFDEILAEQGAPGEPVYRQIPFPQMGAALDKGQVDAVHAVEPYDSAIQDYGRSLYPWLTVRDNVALPLRRRGLGRSERRAEAERILERVGLDGTAGHHPWQLSGGMQQRVAIARALVCRPSLLLMDEPFGSLDAQTREDLEDLLLEVHRTEGTTIVFVTHDIDESVYVGDRVVVLSPGPGSHVVLDLPVELPGKREQIGTRGLPEFVALRVEVGRAVRGT